MRASKSVQQNPEFVESLEKRRLLATSPTSSSVTPQKQHPEASHAQATTLTKASRNSDGASGLSFIDILRILACAGGVRYAGRMGSLIIFTSKYSGTGLALEERDMTVANVRAHLHASDDQFHVSPAPLRLNHARSGEEYVL